MILVAMITRPVRSTTEHLYRSNESALQDNQNFRSQSNRFQSPPSLHQFNIRLPHSQCRLTKRKAQHRIRPMNRQLCLPATCHRSAAQRAMHRRLCRPHPNLRFWRVCHSLPTLCREMARSPARSRRPEDRIEWLAPRRPRSPHHLRRLRHRPSNVYVCHVWYLLQTL